MFRFIIAVARCALKRRSVFNRMFDGHVVVISGCWTHLQPPEGALNMHALCLQIHFNRVFIYNEADFFMDGRCWCSSCYAVVTCMYHGIRNTLNFEPLFNTVLPTTRKLGL